MAIPLWQGYAMVNSVAYRSVATALTCRPPITDPEVLSTMEDIGVRQQTV
jgi:hypothetical protein